MLASFRRTLATGCSYAQQFQWVVDLSARRSDPQLTETCMAGLLLTDSASGIPSDRRRKSAHHIQLFFTVRDPLLDHLGDGENASLYRLDLMRCNVEAALDD